ncbi:transcriptional regulator NrdR [Candidatus Formimonas warabiya]|uniref:Transcriptional repressor NrdR n=1 Tax=Formimonas warabiya TaxID=1761012 RepID=A0A3G1KRF1_FORW1|nr:transcriptional regulator NrdR [Candidatus Formimonas warabiya]ATW25031.1 transcriptional regulator NrdR [Candidatus Formimonas warabiya]
MRCPFCSFEDSKVLDSRPAEEGRSIRRRRECLKCQRRFTTYEKIEELPLIVVKKDGRREVFDSRKVLNGIIKACEKRPVSFSKLEGIVEDIEKDLSNSLEREIFSQTIGEMVMERLKNLDEVAYVRFASVYRQFKDINTFIEEILLLQKK